MRGESTAFSSFAMSSSKGDQWVEFMNRATKELNFELSGGLEHRLSKELTMKISYE